MTQEKTILQSGPNIETGGLKIIGAGFGRTGTRSLKEALEMLGFGPCYHMVELFEHSEHFAHWEAALKGESTDWHEIFQGYQATVDWPACTFYKELMATYPDAKVLLSVRDPEKWYESAMSTIYGISRRRQRSPFAPLLILFLKLVNPRVPAIISMVNRLIWNGTFQGRFEEKEFAISVFNQHNEEVRRYVPPEKLLVYNVKEGWEPLCAFLDVPIPDTPFPHLNDRQSFPGNRIGQEIQKHVLKGVMIAATATLALFFLHRRNAKSGTKSDQSG